MVKHISGIIIGCLIFVIAIITTNTILIINQPIVINDSIIKVNEKKGFQDNLEFKETGWVLYGNSEHTMPAIKRYNSSDGKSSTFYKYNVKDYNIAYISLQKELEGVIKIIDQDTSVYYNENYNGFKTTVLFFSPEYNKVCTKVIWIDKDYLYVLVGPSLNHVKIIENKIKKGESFPQ